jgi:Protein of unknown function (DUF3187)
MAHEPDLLARYIIWIFEDSRVRILAFLLLLSASAAAAQTETVDEVPIEWRRPLGSRNQTPLALFFVYMTPDRAATLAKGDLDLDIVFDYTNIIQEQRTENEFLRFDLEYLRTLVSLKRGFGHGLDLSFEVPFYVYYGGFLDSFVSGFHDALGLPNLLRGQTPYGLVDYQYQRGDQSVLAGTDSFGAVGEPTVKVKKTLYEGAPYALSLRGALKLPTGDPQNLSGSGATDLGLGFAFDRIGPKYGLYLNANYHFLGTPERFETRDFFSFMAGVDWRFKPRLAAVLQVDYMRPPIRGELVNLNDPGIQVALGLRFRHSEAFSYEWRLVEDLSSFSPDFTIAFQMEVRSKGARR